MGRGEGEGWFKERLIGKRIECQGSRRVYKGEGKIAIVREESVRVLKEGKFM